MYALGAREALPGRPEDIVAAKTYLTTRIGVLGKQLVYGTNPGVAVAERDIIVLSSERADILERYGLNLWHLTECLLSATLY